MAKTAPKEKPSVDEKVLTDKLIDELRASGADLSKLTQNVTLPAAATSDAPVPEPPAPPPEPEPDSPPVPVKKKIHFPQLSLPKLNQKANPPPPPESPPASPAAVELTNEALKDMVDEKIAKINQSDMLVIRLNKKELLIAAGLIIAILWLQPVMKSLPLSQVSPASLGALVSKPTPAPVSTEAAPSPQPSPAPLTIRVRLGANSLETATQIKTLLKPLQATAIDVIYDAQVHPTQTLVVTHQNNPELREKIAQLIAQKYTVASEAATLTDDSNFSATILIGKNAVPKP